MLSLNSVSVCINGHSILSDVTLSLAEGQWLMLAGPNGAGKSTLIRAISGAVPYTGQISLSGRDLRQMSSALRARQIGILAQVNSVAYDYTVEEIVSLGRYAHRKTPFSPFTKSDTLSIEDALSLTGIQHLRHKSMLHLSGGECQRVFLAQVFAQNPNILILDEPTNHLDLTYQQQIFGLITSWVQHPNRAVLSVVHDLALARKYGTHALLLHNGHIAAYGRPEEVFTARHLNPVYEMDVAHFMQELYKPWEQAPSDSLEEPYASVYRN
ncbi:MAG: ABC transporter ATP-binding protein [Clostridia bacterium]|nr:ABC transporter ATP-binding protein [Clostridia bacterium]